MNVFLGTLPLTGSILWGLIQNDRRLGRIETKLDAVDVKLAKGFAELFVRTADSIFRARCVEMPASWPVAPAPDSPSRRGPS